MRCLLLNLVLILLVAACNKEENDTFSISTERGIVNVSLRKGNNINELISEQNDSTISIWPLRYPVFTFQHGDVNHDGTEDLAVGVIKATRYDSVRRKRLFLFQVRNRSIIPLWLGSSLSHPLVDFKIVKNENGKTLIHTIEKERSGKYLLAEYEWYGFGMTLRKYLKRELSLEEAEKFHLN